MCRTAVHTPQTLGGTCFPSDCSQLGAFLSPSLSPSSGPAGDSTDTRGPAHAHPGASPDRHVHAGEVSQAAGREGMLGSDPWDPRQAAYLVCFWGGKHPLSLLLYWTVVLKLMTFPMQTSWCPMPPGCPWISVVLPWQKGQGSWQFWREPV